MLRCLVGVWATWILLGGCYRHVRPHGPSQVPEQARGTMVTVPAGTFVMGDRTGDPSEYPERRLQIPAFRIDRTEVSNGQYLACVRARACDPSPYADDPILGAELHPVVGVTWYDARAFCRWAGKRLPTEAEWERAARGSDLRKWPWAGAFDPSKANTRSGDPFEKTAPVNGFQAGMSPFTLLHMAGNAAEWVEDGFDPVRFRRAPTDPSPPPMPSARRRVVRGGSYADPSHVVRVSARDSMEATESSNTVGFRCAAAAE